MGTNGEYVRGSLIIMVTILASSLPLALASAAEPAEASESQGSAASNPADGGSSAQPAMPRLNLDLLYTHEREVGQARADVSFGQVGEDMFLGINLSMAIVGDEWVIAPRVPVRLRVVDRAPTTKSVIRREDWDEVSDYARLIAFAQYGRPTDPFYVRFGEFAGASVGHGTIVNRYYNTIDIDHYQGGIVGAFDLGVAGGELLVDNVLGPEIVVTRPYARPFHLLGTWPTMFRNLKIGVTVGSDFAAPIEKATSVSGSNQLGASESEALSFLGVDLELPLLSLEKVDVVPFFDLNAIDDLGLGFHFGSFITARFTELTEWRTRLEYRLSGAGYEPGYVGPFYEVHRLSFRDGMSQLGWLRTHPQPSRSGFLVESEFRIIGAMSYLVAVSHDEGGKGQAAINDLLMRLHFPKIGPVSVSAFYARLAFQDFDDFADPKRTIFAVNVRYNITGNLYVRGRLLNEWWLREGANGQSAYEATTDYDFGAGVIFDL